MLQVIVAISSLTLNFLAAEIIVAVVLTLWTVLAFLVVAIRPDGKDVDRGTLSVKTDSGQRRRLNVSVSFPFFDSQFLDQLR